jgi:hypothetical protein
MSCEPHAQVLSPCSDDAATLLVLGTRGDVAFDESGYLDLTEGQEAATIDFLYQKQTNLYRFEYLYITEEGAATPADIRAVPNEQTDKSFTVQFSGSPITAGCRLYWRVIVPDNLHTCQGLTNQPQYALVRPTQEGLTLIPSDQDYVDIEFQDEMTTADWVFDALVLEFDPGQGSVPSEILVFAYTIILRTTLGCRIMLSGSADIIGYRFRWRAG